MAVSSTSQVPTKFKDSETEASPARANLFLQPKSKTSGRRKVDVVYYLSRNGQLQHPHFMEVTLSSPEGLYLKDVINRLSSLRGEGMAKLYSWSSKRSYKSGFVWHDLAENDFIYPVNGSEYILKGSELLEPHLNDRKTIRSLETAAINPSENRNEESNFPAIARRRNKSWSSIDLNEYKVYKAEPFSESSRKLAADASTQTDDKRRRSTVRETEVNVVLRGEDRRMEREEIEISPPPSDSSPETLESLMKADGRLILGSGNGDEESLNRTAENCGRGKASTVLMQLIWCGSMSFRDCGAATGRAPRGEGTSKEFSGTPRTKREEKECFSGSLIGTKKQEIPALKRSTSDSADR